MKYEKRIESLYNKRIGIIKTLELLEKQHKKAEQELEKTNELIQKEFEKLKKKRKIE